MLILVSMDL